MILPITIFLISFLLIVLSIHYVLSIYNSFQIEDCTILIIPFLLISIITAPFFIVGSNHFKNLALIRNGSNLIKIRQQAITDIDNQLKSIKIASSALINADSPIRTLIQTKSKFISEITEESIKIEQAKIKIEERSMGFYSIVVKIYGKE
jgi:hypothetical protein